MPDRGAPPTLQMALQNQFDPLLSGAKPGADFAHAQRRVILVVDWVESVRQMAMDEVRGIACWRAFVDRVRADVLPRTKGSLVKSLGDGLMLTFSHESQALVAAFALVRHAQAASGASLGIDLSLRIGVHAGDVQADDLDIYGNAANLAARLATVGGPGQIIVSAAVRDQLVDAVDGHLVDLGDCYLKHIERPVQAFRVEPAIAFALPTHDRPMADAIHPPTSRSTLAVVPFVCHQGEAAHVALGDLMADGINALLCQSGRLQLIARLSTRAFRDRALSAKEVGEFLGADFVVSGGYWMQEGGKKATLSFEIAHATTAEVIAAERMPVEIDDLLRADSDGIATAVACIQRALDEHALSALVGQAIPSLPAYALRLRGIGLMHRASTTDFESGHAALQALVERHRRLADGHAWLAKWHVLRVIRGLSDDPARDAGLAKDACRKALDVDPTNALALAVYGYALAQLFGDGQAALSHLNAAVAANPNEHHAWLYKSVAASMYGDTAQSVADALHAKLLSPTDPHACFVDTVLAAALAFDSQHAKAIAAAQRALRLDAQHAPALRALMLAQYESGEVEPARATLQRILRVNPGLTAQTYLAMGSAQSQGRQRVAQVLIALGL